MSDPLALELRRLGALVEAQSELLADLQRRLLEKADRRAGRLLVPAIVRVVGADQPFTVAYLAGLALDADTPAAGVVRDALDEHADEDGGLRGMGRLLQRLQGVPLAGWRIQRVNEDRWRVVAGFSAK